MSVKNALLNLLVLSNLKHALHSLIVVNCDLTYFSKQTKMCIDFTFYLPPYCPSFLKVDDNLGSVISLFVGAAADSCAFLVCLQKLSNNF